MASSAREARQFVAEVLGHWSLPGELAETAELLTSELVSNVVLHACTELEVSVSPEAGRAVRVEVADESLRPPVPRKPTRDALTGRGLILVDALAADWGVEPTSGGKAVWFELQR